MSGGVPAGADPAGATRPAHGGPAGQFSVPVAELKAAWQATLPAVLGSILG